VGNLWIACDPDFGERKHSLSATGTWTPLFFLDDAVALAAGHRPCGFCRRSHYRDYQLGVTKALGQDALVGASILNRRLATERLASGRGLSRAGDRKLWTAFLRDLPDGTIVLALGNRPHLWINESLQPFSFDGWGHPVAGAGIREVAVLTPPTSVLALGNGYTPLVHPSAMRG